MGLGDDLAGTVYGLDPAAGKILNPLRDFAQPEWPSSGLFGRFHANMCALDRAGKVAYAFAQEASAGDDRDAGALLSVDLATGATRARRTGFAVSGALFYDVGRGAVLGLHAGSNTVYAFDATTLEPTAAASAGAGVSYVSNTAYDASSGEFFFYGYDGGPAWVSVPLRGGGTAGVSRAGGMNAFASSWDAALQRFVVLQGGSGEPTRVELAARRGNVTGRFGVGLPSISGGTPWAYNAAAQEALFVASEDASLGTFFVTASVPGRNATKARFDDNGGRAEAPFCVIDTRA